MAQKHFDALPCFPHDIHASLDASFLQYGGLYEWGKSTAEHDDGI